MVALLLLLLGGCHRHDLQPPPETPLVFPADHGVHHDAQTEWWYLQSVVNTDDGRRLAVFLSTLRHDPQRDRIAGLPVPSGDVLLHWACIADLDTGERVTEKWTAGLVRAPFHGLQDAVDGWFTERARRWRTWGAEGRFSWDVPTKLGRLRLHATATTEPMPIGAIPLVEVAAATGRTVFDGAAFSYYTFPRVEVLGEFLRGKDRTVVAGDGWLDHQYGFIYSDLYLGWWWVVVMLEDGTDLLLTRVTPRKEGVEPVLLGTIRPPGEPARVLGEFRLTPDGMRNSDRTRAAYPTGLQIEIPGEGLSLHVVPVREDSEWKVKPAPLWEGPVTIEGTWGGEKTAGVGFAEFLQHGDVFGRGIYSSGDR